MKRYDYRTEINNKKNSNESKITESSKNSVQHFLTTHKKMVINGRYEYFYHTLLPVLKDFAFCNSGLLEVEETDFFIVAKLTCDTIAILEEESDFTHVFNYANLKTFLLSEDGHPRLELYFRCYEYISISIV